MNTLEARRNGSLKFVNRVAPDDVTEKAKSTISADLVRLEAFLGGLERLAKLGVTWVQVALPGDSLAHVLDVIERFKALVIDAV